MELIPLDGEEMKQSSTTGGNKLLQVIGSTCSNSLRKNRCGLTPIERLWIKSILGTVQEMLIYGSKARGQAHAESEAAQLSVGQWSVTQCVL